MSQWPWLTLPEDLGEIVSGLRWLLEHDGLVGLIVGDHRWLGEMDSWTKGTSVPPKAWMTESLREAYKAAMVLGQVMPEWDLRLWFVSLHPALDFKAPVEVVSCDPERFKMLVNTTYADLVVG